VLRGLTKVPSIYAMPIPGAAVGWFGVDNDTGPRRRRIGVQLKSNGPLSWASAESHGLRRDCRRRFNVVVAWKSSRSQRCIGKFLLVLLRPATKWFLNVCMARSAEFGRCRCGGTSWKSTDSALMKHLRPAGASLSNFWRMGCRPRCTREQWTTVYARRSSASKRFFIGSARMALLS
jgi:hypothetical protein